MLCYTPPPPPSVWLRSRGWGKGVTSTPTCSNSSFCFFVSSSWFFTCILFWHLNTYIISDTDTRHTPLHLLQLWQARFLQRYRLLLGQCMERMHRLHDGCWSLNPPPFNCKTNIIIKFFVRIKILQIQYSFKNIE